MYDQSSTTPDYMYTCTTCNMYMYTEPKPTRCPRPSKGEGEAA